MIVIICIATTDNTSISIRLNSSKQAQAPELSERETREMHMGLGRGHRLPGTSKLSHRALMARKYGLKNPC